MSNLDTLYTINLNDNSSGELFETIRIIAIFLAGYFLNYIYQLIQERKRIKKLKKYFVFCINTLDNSVQKQVQLITEFNEQFKKRKYILDPVRMDADLQIYNINAISSNDVFEIIDKYCRSKEFIEKSKLFSNFNYSVRVIEKASGSMEILMNRYIDESNNLKSEWSLNKRKIETQLLELTLNSIENKLDNNERAFWEEVIKLPLPSNALKNEDVIHFFMEKRYLPLNKIAASFKIYRLVEPISSIITLYNQLNFNDEHYFNLFKNISEELIEASIMFNQLKEGLK